MFKVGGLSFFVAGLVVFLFFLALIMVQTSPTLTPEMILDNPVPPVSLYTLAAFGELSLMPGVLGLYVALKNIKKTHMLMGTALWMVAVVSFLVSRSQIISLLPISGSYQATTSAAMQAAYLVSAEHVIELSNVFATLALMFFGIASIITGLAMLKGVFSKGISYVVIIADTLTLLGLSEFCLNP